MGEVTAMSKKRKINFVRLLLVVFIIYAVFILAKQQFDITEAQEKNQNLQQHVNAIVQENDMLKQRLENANSDEYIERMAREQLGMVKKGERIYVDQGESKGDSLKEE